MRNSCDQKADTLHRAIRHLKHTHWRIISEEFAKIGLTEGQPKIIGFLIRNDGCIQRELASHCQIKSSTVTSLLANMERSGLIYRISNPQDKRILNVYLTEKGRAVHEEIERIFAKVDEECFLGFTVEEKNQTIDLLNRICENLRKEEEMKNNDTAG